MWGNMGDWSGWGWGGMGFGPIGMVLFWICSSGRWSVW